MIKIPSVRIVIASAILFVLGCVCYASCALVEPGHVGIKVRRAGPNRGVQDIPIVSGWVVYNPVVETIIEFPMTTQTATWHTGEAISFASREGVSVTADVSLSYHVDSQLAGRLYTRFRVTELDALTHGYVRNLVRDALNETASQMSIQDIYGAGKTRLLSEAMRMVRDRLGMDGFIVDQLSFQGALQLPANVVAAINRSIEQTQQAISAQNRVAQVEAEARQRVAQAEGEANAAQTRARGDAESLLIRMRADAESRRVMAEAEARANDVVRASITVDLTRYRQVQRWDGRLPQVTGNAATMLQLPGVGQ